MQFKLQFRLWHLFALVTIAGVLCAFEPLRWGVAGTLVVVLLAYALTLGFLLLCRASLALVAIISEEMSAVLKRRRN
jgi:hypothetical protein